MNVKRYQLGVQLGREAFEYEIHAYPGDCLPPLVVTSQEFVLAKDHEATLADLRASYEREIQTWYDKLQAADATVIERDRRIAELTEIALARADALAERDRRIAELEQFKAWAEPQIVTHGQDQLRIEALLDLLKSARAHVQLAVARNPLLHIPRALLSAIDAQLAPVGGASDDITTTHNGS